MWVKEVALHILEHILNQEEKRCLYIAYIETGTNTCSCVNEIYSLTVTTWKCKKSRQ